MITQEYAVGRFADIHGEGSDGLVLLWHGKGADSRDVVADLAAEIAGHGVRVVVPDWRSSADDHGRADLLASLELARSVANDVGLDPDRLVVAGWSLGGTAAVGLVMAEPTLRVRIGSTVLLSPGDGPRAIDAFSGQPLPDRFPSRSTPVHVVSATRDDIATPELVRGLEARLGTAGWQTTWTDVDADHGSIAMSRYDAAADRFVAADDESAIAAGRRSAAIIAAAATS